MKTASSSTSRSNLEQYLEKAHGNAQKVLARGGAWIRLIRAVDEAYVVAGESLEPTPGTVVGAFVIGSHSAWLAAANLGLSMHSADSLQPARVCLESAFYGYKVHRDKAAFERWKRRPTMVDIRSRPADEAELRRVRRQVGAEFSVTAIARTFPSQCSELARRATELYEETIDYGAHFNFAAFKPGFRATGQREDYYSAEVRILRAQEHEQVFAFRKITEAGLTALQVLDAAIGNGWDGARIRSILGGVTNGLRKRPAERLGRRRAT